MPTRQSSTSFSPLNPTISTSTSSQHSTGEASNHFSASRQSLNQSTTSQAATIRRDSHLTTDEGEPALLVPTDRGLDEFLKIWVGQLGRVSFDREIVLPGYAIYALRTWYLSRDHWSQTIVTQTGKQTEQISLYRLVADPSLNNQDAEAEIARATQFLAAETKSTPRKTDQGLLLVTTPSAFGQDAFFVPGGDLREARPYLVVNTGLRRLGCGGRAAMTLETPIVALQKKFLDSYRLPTPPNQPSPSRPNSPQSSPSKPSTLSSQSPISPRPHTQHPILADPLCSMVLELVRLIQGSLALWGLFEQDMIDGLFCDETKKGIFAWRRNMGMEHEEALKIEKETSGGCIDPKTVAVLLSSVTSSYYQLNHISPEHLPRDPFTKVRRFLAIWSGYHTSSHHSTHHNRHLSIHTIRSITSDFYHLRSRSGTDALKVHRFLFSGVASATSSISANLKGGHIDDTPLRKREYLSRVRAEPDGDTSRGLALIVPDDELSPTASPNVITSNLEAYLNGILKTREKDWDVLGARRIGWLWSDHTSGTESKGRSFVRDVVRRRTQSRDFGHGYHGPIEDSDDSPPGPLGPLNGVVRRTGSVLIGGLNGLVSRKGTTYETSDSEAGPGPSSLRSLVRKKQSVPVVVEPGVNEMGEFNTRASLSPSPTFSARPPANPSTRASYLSAISNTSKLPSIITSLSANNSTLSLNRLLPPENTRRSSVLSPDTRQPPDQWEGPRGTTTERAVAWRDVGRETAMLRTASDGADVAVEEGGNEWEVINPHGTGRGQHGTESEGLHKLQEVRRRHSFQDREYYQGMRVTAVENLAVDVELCHTIQKLRRQERELADRAAELAIFESSLLTATQHLQTHLSARRHSLSQLRSDAHKLSNRLQDLPHTVDNDEAIQSQINVIAYETTGDTSSKELKWRLETLKEEWEIARRGNEERRRVAENKAEEVVERERKGWWIFG